MLNNDIGGGLKKLRENQHITQKELSKLTNISTSKLSRLDNNNQLPTLEELILILNALNITLVDFFSELEKINKKTIQLEENYQAVLLHYTKHKFYNLSLIKKELRFFKKLYADLGDHNMFNTFHKIEWYLQLTALFPNYFPEINKTLLNNNAEVILKKNTWLQQDYNFFAVGLKYLNPNNIIALSHYYHKMEFKGFTPLERRAFQISIENLTDFLLVNNKQYLDLNIPVKKELEDLFNTWDRYISIYKSPGNQLIRQHNYSIYEFVFNLKDKDKIKEEVELRSKLLKKLELDNFAEPFMDEYLNYENQTNIDTSFINSH